MNQQFKAEVLRWSLLLAGGAVGLMLSAGYAYLLNVLGRMPDLSKDTFLKQAFLMELCLFFYLGLYHTGIIGYRLLKRSAESIEVRQHARPHLHLLHGFAVVMFLIHLVFD